MSRVYPPRHAALNPIGYPSMRFIFKVLPIALLASLVLGVVGGQFLPGERTIERTLSVSAPPSKVFARLANIRGWQGWYIPPDVEVSFEGPEGAGGRMMVEDGEAGVTRSLELTETSSPSVVRYAFPQSDDNPFEIEGTFTLSRAPATASSTVSATLVKSQQYLRARGGGLLSGAGERWFLYILADRLVGSILERELHNLKGVLEGLPPPGSPQ